MNSRYTNTPTTRDTVVEFTKQETKLRQRIMTCYDTLPDILCDAILADNDDVLPATTTRAHLYWKLMTPYQRAMTIIILYQRDNHLNNSVVW